MHSLTVRDAPAGANARRRGRPRAAVVAAARRRVLPLLVAVLVISGGGIAPAQAAPVGGRVALILSGGAARGTAHVGVIRTLVDAGVPIDLIIGTSMGSLIGGLYAAGFDAITLAEVIDAVDASTAGEVLLPPRGGLLDAAPLALLIDALAAGMPLGATPVPFYPIVTDIFSNAPGIAPMASLGTAIQASTAIPVLFEPIEHEGRYYYDGAIRLPIPVALARELGADYVITSTADRDVPYAPGNLQANFSRLYVSLLRDVTAESKLGSDVTLDPMLLDDSYMDFGRSAEFVRAGEQVAATALPGILADLEALGIELRPGGDPNAGAAVNTGWRERLAAARREVAMRPRRWNVTVDVASTPAASGERMTPAPAPVGSRLRFGVDLRDGPLGHGSVGASYARSVNGGDDAVTVRAGYRLSAELRAAARAEFDLGGGWEARASVGWSVSPTLELEASLRWPGPVVEADASWRSIGVAVDAQGAWSPSEGWTRFHLDLRGALAASDPAWAAWTLRPRLMVGTASPSTPERERFSVGPATGLRGTPPDAWVASSLVVGSIEVVRSLTDTLQVLDTALATPSVWCFLDTALFVADGASRTAAVVGIGAGVEGVVFGIVPFGVGVDLGYGFASGSWRLGLRLGPSVPAAWHF